MISFYLAGLLMGISPCCLPMVPVVANVMLASEKPRRSLLLYLAGSVSFFTVFGVISAYLGRYIPDMLQNPAVIIVTAAILIALAVIQLGNIQLPTKAVSILTKNSYLLGGLSTLVLSPCITPFLLGILTYTGIGGNLLSGGIQLLLVGLGANTPLLIAALLGTKWLPKPGRWLMGIKYLMAAILIGLSVSMLFTLTKFEQSEIYIRKTQQVEQKVLIFVTSPTCYYCKSVQEAIDKGAAKGWTVNKVRSYPGVMGTPTLIKIVNGKETGRLVGAQTYSDIAEFLQQ